MMTDFTEGIWWSDVAFVTLHVTLVYSIFVSLPVFYLTTSAWRTMYCRNCKRITDIMCQICCMPLLSISLHKTSFPFFHPATIG